MKTMPPDNSQQRIDEIRNWLITTISNKIGMAPNEIATNEPLTSYGLSSKDAVMLSGDLEDWLGEEFPATLLYEYVTIEALTLYLANHQNIPDSKQQIAGKTITAQEPIAIVGIGCRFPGADNPNEFWELLAKGKNAITEVPAGRWNLDQFYDSDPFKFGKMNTRNGGFLKGVADFDPQFFGISEREAICMDPQQRLLLEVAWEAMEDAGILPKKLANSNVGIFIGISNSDYKEIQSTSENLSDPYAGTGSALSIAANRLSYIFGFSGPSIAIDTACSSSLVSVYLACRSIWSGESSIALAGGVNLILSPTVSINFSKTGFLSTDGQIKAFDASANGYVRGEGAGIIALKPMSKAQEDGDQIYALIRGTAINQDGKSNGLTAPSKHAQESVILQACQNANILPGQVQYVEAHGTGTNLGDPIEANALGKITAIGRPVGTICHIGSVKTNIGHLESAAGIAGLIKVALALDKKAIPPSLNFNTPNPYIPFDKIPLRVQQELGKWPPSSIPKLAGVSSFGFGGTNAHAILEEAPAAKVGPLPDQGKRAKILVLSAVTLPALQSLAKKYLSLLQNAAMDQNFSLADLCYSTATRRDHLEHRLAVVAHSATEMEGKISAFLQSETKEGIYYNAKKQAAKEVIALVFSGQGAEWLGMGQDLMEQEPFFLDQIKQCDSIFSQHADWSIFGELCATSYSSRLGRTEVSQPVVFAIQVALAKLLTKWGIEINAVIGHSMGEIAAAHIAGILSLEDAIKIIYCRSRAMQKTHGKGKMLATGLSLKAAEERIRPQVENLAVAAENSPDSSVISGSPSLIDELAEKLKEEKVYCRLIQPNYAFHSPMMDELLDEFEASIREIKPSAPNLPFYSTLTGQRQDQPIFDASYWVQNVRKPVLFAQAFDQLLQSRHNCFLEIGPHPSLISPISRCFQHRDVAWPILCLLRKSKEDVTVNAIAQLHTLSNGVDWNAYYSKSYKYVKLPSYPWQRKRYWVKETNSTMEPFGGNRGQENFELHPLVHKRWQTAQEDVVFESFLSAGSPAFLGDHQIYGTTIFPSSGYVEMALIAAKETFGSANYKIANLSIMQALVLEQKVAKKVQLIISKNESGKISFKIFSLKTHQGQNGLWELNSSGMLLKMNNESDRKPDLDDAKRSYFKTKLAPQLYYQQLEELGLEYGSSFQGISELWAAESKALASIVLPDSVLTTAENYQTHPVLLDACFQVVKATIPKESDKAEVSFMPISLDAFEMYEKLPPKLWCEAILNPISPPQSISADLLIYKEKGQLVARVKGLLLKAVSLELLQLATKQNKEDWLYEVCWKKAPIPLSDAMPTLLPSECWLVFANRDELCTTFLTQAKALGVTCLAVYPAATFSDAADGSIGLVPSNPAHFFQLWENSQKNKMPINRVIHLWSLETGVPEDRTTASLVEFQELTCGSLLHLCKAIHAGNPKDLPRLSLVCRGGQQVTLNDPPALPWQALLWGFGNVIPLDFPQLPCQRIDLDSTEGPKEALQLINEIILDSSTDQVAFRKQGRYLPQLAQFANNKEGNLPLPEEEAYYLEIRAKGVLDNLKLEGRKRQPPKDNEVEIQVFAAGLNFRDVMNTLDLYPDEAGPLGYECSGKITAVGPLVKELKIGDEVVAVAAGSFGNFVTTDAQLVVPKPKNISFSEAATIPIAFLTAYYTLVHLGKMKEGDRVLIHSATGGVGIAALQLARQVGAEIYATAGNPEKRSFLKTKGVSHIMNSRSLEYADEILRDTKGKGLDLVLNSLPGDYIPKNLDVLTDTGRFLEIGKIGIWRPAQIAAVKKEVFYRTVDMSERFFSDSVLIRSIFKKVMAGIESGGLRPLPLQEFPIQKAVNAFRYMAQARHIGKVVLTLGNEGATEQFGSRPYTFSATATYLITGGTGGLGLSVAKWMRRKGARHLVLTGRKKPSESLTTTLNKMRKRGVQVEVFQADLSVYDEMQTVFKKIEQSMPPLKGIINAAGILKDGSLFKQDWEDFVRPFAPKVAGAWNLHLLSQKLPLDFFVSFSSIAALLGSQHQANYAAANAFLDGLAHFRRANGLTALSINWGPWKGVGMTTSLNEQQVQRFRAIGMDFITPQVGLQILEKILLEMPTQLAVLPLDLPSFFQQFPKENYPAIFTDLYEENSLDNKEKTAVEAQSPLLKRLKSAPLEERVQILTDHVTEQVVKVLRMDEQQGPDPHKGLAELGMDSLMAVELKNRIESSLGIPLSVALTFDYPNISALAAYLATQIQIPETQVNSIKEDPAEVQTRKDLILEVQQLSEEELEALINDELNKS